MLGSGAVRWSTDASARRQPQHPDAALLRPRVINVHVDRPCSLAGQRADQVRDHPALAAQHGDPARRGGRRTRSSPAAGSPRSPPPTAAPRRPAARVSASGATVCTHRTGRRAARSRSGPNQRSACAAPPPARGRRRPAAAGVRRPSTPYRLPALACRTSSTIAVGAAAPRSAATTSRSCVVASAAPPRRRARPSAASPPRRWRELPCRRASADQ